MNPKLRELLDRLKVESATLADYRTIERKTTELGFPTSVRTLRFYVSEGILPPPQKRGKVPVYPEEFILGTLLAIHLMKTRFSRSLAEIRSILQGVAESPEILADKLTELHALTSSEGGSRIPALHQREVIERFFGALSGHVPLEGRSPGERAQPSELRVTDLLESVQRNGGGAPELPDWEVSADVAVEAKLSGLGELSPGGGLWRGDRGDRPEAGSIGRPVVDVTPPTDGPDGGEERGRGELPAAPRARAGERLRAGERRREEARHLENIFMKAFESGLRSLGSVFHPVEGREYAVRTRTLRPIIGDAYQEVARLLVERRLFDRDVFDSMPLNKSTRFDLEGGGLSGRSRISVIGVAWSPLVELVEAGRSSRALGRSELEEILERYARPPGTYVYLGVHATCGFARELRESLPDGEMLRVALVEYRDGEGWEVRERFPPEASGLAAIFDPEPIAQKLERLTRRLESLDALRVRGGFVDLLDLEKEWGVGRGLLEGAVERVTSADPRLEAATVNGRPILKRVRYVV